VSWHLCTIAADSSRNWVLCKEVSAWGVHTQRENVRSGRCGEGDQLLFWLASKGFAGYARVTENIRQPKDATEAPWLGGPSRYGLIVPFEMELELPKPLPLKFVNHKQEKTGINLFQLRRGFVGINDQAAETAARLIREALVIQQAAATA